MFEHGTGEGKIFFNNSVGWHNVAKIMTQDDHSFTWHYRTSDNSVEIYFDSQYDDVDPYYLLEDIMQHVKSCSIDLRHEGGAVSRLVVKNGKVIEERGEILYEEELETIERVKNALCEVLQDIAVSCGDRYMALSAAGHGLTEGDLEYIGL